MAMRTEHAPRTLPRRPGAIWMRFLFLLLLLAIVVLALRGFAWVWLALLSVVITGVAAFLMYFPLRSSNVARRDSAASGDGTKPSASMPPLR